ncbi:hypothetical protein INF37_10835 [Pseudoflavonifractor sp. DSM 107456]|uniref:AlgX/AlgJ SGNH hydrolase-like domain-containing protein n=1 Tax=Pseudoflavonifractor gallinarum TaxID=2779352 RepID=A0ABR9RCW2_9FIRM|nr:DHHW family protein [Pseudoflavonifractor gallinarum]MBE5056486.1 hypothetical protein [Pseudoflavonifractor gallinarum]
MKHRKETITAVLFFLLLAMGLCYIAFLFLSGQSSLREELGKLRRDPGYVLEFVEQAESALNEDLDQSHGFIQLYGGFQRLSGRRMLEDVNQAARVVRLSNGTLNFSYPDAQPLDVSPQIQAVNDLHDVLAQWDIPLLYVAAPQKIQDGQEEALLPPGIYDYANDNADRLLAGLQAHGTDTWDLRPLFAQQEDYASLFFCTDHHWKPEGAFLAWQELTGILAQDYGIHTPSEYTDPANYETKVYEDYFLGSQGKRTGTLYAGTDDITEYIPRFETNFTYASPSFAQERTGTFSQSLLFPERVAERDWFGGNPYTLYSGGDYGIATMTNHLNPDGKKIVLLRESFSCALAPFLALSCSELTTIDLRYFDGDLLDTLREIDPDLVLTLYCVSSISNQDLFTFQQGET